MIIKCAWCGRDLGMKKPIEDENTSHGICKKCAEKALRKVDGYTRLAGDDKRLKPFGIECRE